MNTEQTNSSKPHLESDCVACDIPTDRAKTFGLSFLDGMYEVRADERAAFGRNWCGPRSLEHGADTLVAKYPSTGGDGYAVEVYCGALPARFYRVRALPTPNSVNEPRDGFSISTGSGSEMALLIASLAKHIADGMIGCEAEPVEGSSQTRPSNEGSPASGVLNSESLGEQP